MLTVGRVCVKLAGREAGKKCVIVEVIDKNFVLVDGDVKRRRCNIDHLMPLAHLLPIKSGANTKTVQDALAKVGVDVSKKEMPKKAKPKKEKMPRPKKEKLIKSPDKPKKKPAKAAKPVKKAPAKKPAAKKAPAKKVVKKAPAKKSAMKKSPSKKATKKPAKKPAAKKAPAKKKK